MPSPASITTPMRALLVSLLILLTLLNGAAPVAIASETAMDSPTAQFVKPDQAMESSLTSLTVVYVGLVVLVIVYVTFLTLRLRKAAKQVAALQGEVDALKAKKANGPSASPLA